MGSDLNNIRKLKLEKKVYRLRHREGLSWDDVSSKVNKEFEKEFSNNQVQEIYDKYVSRPGVIINTKRDAGKEAKRLMIDWDKRMEEKFVEIDKWVSKLMKQMGKVFDKMVDEDNWLGQVKLVPTLLAVCREILSQISVMKKDQEKIVLNQKNFVLNETQILQIVNKKMSQRERDSGYTIDPLTQKLIPMKKSESFA